MMQVRIDETTGEVLGYALPGFRLGATDGVRIIEIPDSNLSVLEAGPAKIINSSAVANSARRLANLKRRKLAVFALEMDREIRGLIPALSAAEREVLPNYLEFALAIQLNAAGAGQIWTHFQGKIAEIRAAADETTLDAIIWRS